MDFANDINLYIDLNRYTLYNMYFKTSSTRLLGRETPLRFFLIKKKQQQQKKHVFVAKITEGWVPIVYTVHSRRCEYTRYTIQSFCKERKMTGYDNKRERGGECDLLLEDCEKPPDGREVLSTTTTEYVMPVFDPLSQ